MSLFEGGVCGLHALLQQAPNGFFNARQTQKNKVRVELGERLLGRRTNVLFL